MQPQPDSTILILVRHGATTANEQKPYILQGSSIDLPLSPNGEKQAEAVADFLSTFPIGRIYCSTMLRARQTAGEIARRHSLEIASLPEIVECGVGLWEGMDWESIKEQFPEESHRFLANPADNAYLGGESYGDVLRRVGPVFERLLELHRGEIVVVVAHNVVNRVYVADLLKLDLKLAKDLHQSNCCVNVIQRSRAGTHLITMNSTFHLDSLDR